MNEEQLFKITEAIGLLTAKVDRLIFDQEQAAGKRDAMAADVSDLKRQVEDIKPKIERGISAAERMDKIETMGKGYLAGAAVSGAIAGGSALIWLQDHIKALFGLMKA